MVVPRVRDNAREDFLVMEVASDLSLETLKALVESEAGIPTAKQTLFFHNRALTNDTHSLEGVGIRDRDLITVHEARADVRPDERAVRNQPQDDGEILRLQALGDPNIMAQIRRYRPELADVVNDPRRFSELWSQMRTAQAEAEAETERNMQRLNEDPFDVEAQGKIEESIRAERVQENLQHALDFTPEGMNLVLSFENASHICGGTHTIYSKFLPILSADQILQHLAGCICFISRLRSTASISRLSLTRVRKQP